jgi:hypothetical protein
MITSCSNSRQGPATPGVGTLAAIEVLDFPTAPFDGIDGSDHVPVVPVEALFVDSLALGLAA